MDRFNYPYSGDSLDACIRHLTSTYIVSINNEEYEKVRNLDSMRLNTRLIATRLYTNVMSDFIIANSSEILVRIESKPANASQSFGNSYSATFDKKDLEKYCGFSIKDKGNHFSREKSAVRSDTLTISKEHIIE